MDSSQLHAAVEHGAMGRNEHRKFFLEVLLKEEFIYCESDRAL